MEVREARAISPNTGTVAPIANVGRPRTTIIPTRWASGTTDGARRKRAPSMRSRRPKAREKDEAGEPDRHLEHPVNTERTRDRSPLEHAPHRERAERHPAHRRGEGDRRSHGGDTDREGGADLPEDLPGERCEPDTKTSAAVRAVNGRGCRPHQWGQLSAAGPFHADFARDPGPIGLCTARRALSTQPRQVEIFLRSREWHVTSSRRNRSPRVTGQAL